MSLVDYKDGLIRVYSRDGMKSGYAVDSRLMWALGNYSRFIRPGAVRYEVSSSADFDPYGVMCSAYRNADGSWVVVAINYSEDLKPLSGSGHQLQRGPEASVAWVL